MPKRQVSCLKGATVLGGAKGPVERLIAQSQALRTHGAGDAGPEFDGRRESFQMKRRGKTLWKRWHLIGPRRMRRILRLGDEEKGILGREEHEQGRGSRKEQGQSP